MANNRELSQVAGFIIVDDTSGNIGIASTATPFVGIGTTNPLAKLHVVGNTLITGITTLGVTTTTSLFSNQLSVSGLSTFIGIGTFQNDLYVGGNLFIKDDLVFDEATVRNINVTGVSTLGIASATTLFVSGVSTFANNVNLNGELRGPAEFIIDPAAVGDNTGAVRIKGDLFVDGVQTVINSTTIELADFIVGIASTATTDLLADGAGIKIGPDNTLLYEHSNTALKSSENLNLASGKTYKINGTDVLSSTTLGSGVVNSSLTSVGILTSLNVAGLSTFAGITTVTGPTLFSKQLNVSGVSTFHDIVNIGSSITAYPATGIISATAFYGDGLNLANTGSTLSPASGTQRVVLTSQTTGTMTQSATNSDLVYNSSTSTLSGTNFAPTHLSVSGVSTFNGPISTGSTTGSNGQYLQSTGVGVTWASFPTLRTTQTNIATDGADLFNFSYNVNFLDVFINGVKLTSSEFTASNGTSITLATPAFANDIVEFVSYNTTSAGGGGGSGTPGGSNTQVQFNDGGSFGGDAGLTYNKTSDVLSVGGLNVTGVSTLGNTIVGGATTQLVVNGNTRIAGILTIGTSSITLDGTSNQINVGTAVTVNSSGVTITGVITATSFSGSGINLTGIVTSIASGSGISIDQSTGKVTITATGGSGSIAGIDTTGTSTFTNLNVTGVSTFAGITTVTGTTLFAKQLNVSGVVTASSFSGSGIGLTGIPAGQLTGALPAIDGSALTNLIGVGAGVIVRDSGTLVGTAGTIDFGDNLTVSTISAGIVTVSSSGGGGSFVTTAAGIHTLSNVGIGTTNPQTPLQVERYGITTGLGTFNASAGIATDIDTFTIATTDFKTAEYTLHFIHSSNIQAQKVLVMQNGTTAYSQEYGVMSDPNLIVSVGATISSGVCKLQVIPETGISGLTTYRFTRETML